MDAPLDVPGSFAENESDLAGRNRSHSTSQPIDIPGAVPRERHYNAAGFPATPVDSDFEGVVSPTHAFEQQLQVECMSPQPPKFLKATGYPPRNLPQVLKDAAAKRRAALTAGYPFDDMLNASTFTYDGTRYLLLTTEILMKLSPEYDDLQLFSDNGLFKNIMLDEQINTTPDEHAIAALRRVGSICEHLVIKGPIKVSAHGTIFNCGSDDAGTDNDWLTAFSCLTNLSTVTVGKDTGVSMMDHENLVWSIEAALRSAYEGKSMPTLTVA